MQTTFASLAFARKKKQTRRGCFLAEMEAVVPWAALLSVIEPHYSTTGRRGRPPMLRVYFMQQWYALTDANKRFNHKMSSDRAGVEHVFRLVKRQFGYTKVRYKGIAKNAAQVFSLIGLTNRCPARHALMSRWAKSALRPETGARGRVSLEK